MEGGWCSEIPRFFPAKGCVEWQCAGETEWSLQSASMATGHKGERGSEEEEEGRDGGREEEGCGEGGGLGFGSSLTLRKKRRVCIFAGEGENTVCTWKI